MLSSENEQPQQGGRSCFSYGCVTVVAVAVILAAWIGSGFVFWKQCRIPLPDGSGSVVYMAKLNRIMCAEWDRKVRLETKRFYGRDKWIPGDYGGADPVKVYWYPSKGNTGPYLRFSDPMWDYLVDLRRGTTLLAEYRRDSATVGEMSSSWPKRSYVDDEAKAQVVGTVDGRPVQKMESYVASQPGQYIGRIEYPFNHFVSSKESPEAALPKH